MNEYDKAVLQCFLEKQGQLFPEPVAQTEEEAAWFLEDMMAVVVSSVKEVVQYFEEAGVDFSEEEILDASEVFPLGDGRYLIVEG
ncbi:MAG: glyoxalase [Eubacterium sp.]|nr:glyoxalase [Eubacterium sp.]